MQRHLAARFPQDADGRLEPGEETPRFALGLTPRGNLGRFRADLSAARVVALARLAAREPAPDDLDRLPERYPSFEERLGQDAPLEHAYFGGVWRFPEVLAAAPDAEALGPEEAGLIAESFPDIAATLAVCQPCCAISLDADEVVSVCATATLRNGIAEPRVETRAGFRRQGHGSRAVAAWDRAVRGRGDRPVFAASVANRGARGIAQRLGLIRFGSDLHMR